MRWRAEEMPSVFERESMAAGWVLRAQNTRASKSTGRYHPRRRAWGRLTLDSTRVPTAGKNPRDSSGTDEGATADAHHRAGDALGTWGG